VSGEEHLGSSASPEAQRRALEAECRRRGWRLVEVAEEAGFSAEDERGDTQALVAGKLDRPSRSLLELARLLASAQKQGFALVALECAAETTTAAAREARVNVLATFAAVERGNHSQRVRRALAAKRAQGVRLGRPPTISPYALERIRRERAAGKSLAAIANGLNADRIPTAQGGRRWYPATVRYTLERSR
jgi:DNA invertase Pin-like site-specific DNA recombinase